MPKEDLTYQLRLEIKRQLGKVTKANGTNIWNEIHKPDGSLNLQGYARIEAGLIKRILAGQLTPTATIPQLECEMEE
jgi:hypothetical protein